MPLISKNEKHIALLVSPFGRIEHRVYFVVGVTEGSPEGLPMRPVEFRLQLGRLLVYY